MISIRPIAKTEISLVVDVHNKSFKNFFLTELGSDFLYIYYDSIRKDTNGVLIGYFSNDKLCGFSAASLHSKGFNFELINKNLIRFSVAGLRILFNKPRALLRLVKNLNKTQNTIEDDGNYAELFSIAITPEAQGQGIGKKILTELELVLKNKNIFRVSLTTDYYDNESSLAFYNRMGYAVLYEFTTYPDRRMYRLIKDL